MLEFIKGWAMNIVVVAIFVTFIEMALPNSTMKRYINVIIGLLIMIVILNPFINLISSNMNIEKEVFANITKFNESSIQEQQTFMEDNNKQIINLYKNKLIKDLKRIIENQTNYLVYDIKLDIHENPDDKAFASIKGLKVYLEDKKDKLIEDKNGIKIDYVDDVQINLDNKVNDSAFTLDQENEVVSILNKTYDIPKENIMVYKNSNGGD